MTLCFRGEASVPLATHELSFLSPGNAGGGGGPTSSSLTLMRAGPGANPAAVLEQALWPPFETRTYLSPS